MSMDYRSVQILNCLIEEKTHLSLKTLTNKFQISTRTLYYDIEKINYWLQQQGLHRIVYVKSLGYSLDEKTKEIARQNVKKLNHWQYEYSPKERKARIILLLLTDGHRFLLEDFMTRNRVSRNTTLTDLKCLNRDLKRFYLRLEFNHKLGYVIQGDEFHKRRALISYVTWLIPDQGSLLDGIKAAAGLFFSVKTIEQIQQRLVSSEQMLHLSFTDEVLEKLSVYLFLFCKRFVNGNAISIDLDEKQVLKTTKHYQAAQYIAEGIESIYDVVMPEDEICYIATHLLGAKVQSVERFENMQNHITLIQQVIDKMVEDFQKNACVFFSDVDDLKNDLLLHLKPAYFRLKYNIQMENAITHTIIKCYPEVFHLTKTVIQHFEALTKQQMTNDEIAFVAMHFGGWLKKEGLIPITRKKAIIVCANGVGTSRILQNQLKHLFTFIDIQSTLSKREFEQTMPNVDLIFSTVSLPSAKVPVIMVQPILTDEQKTLLLKNVHMVLGGNATNNSVQSLLQLISKHAVIKNKKALIRDLRQYFYEPHSLVEEGKPLLSDLLTKDYIQFIERLDSWEEAIRCAAQPLVEKQYITEAYEEAMIQNVKELGPYIVIAPGIAIPHARPEYGVKKLGMSFLRIKEPVSFTDQPEHQVQLMIVLAAIDNETHLKALAQLTTLLTNKSNINRLIETNDTNDVLALVKQYSIEED
ncbi:BglG family transcription antiterminator [Bacillus chungangensis]|uniref:Transcriptional antiterminator/mannitol/fructose-specific phosphotransferase system IIA component (Ntr-type) n=1 Tax=Bacillus chungangensis TaxID=587633 RepID=A0ABT9WXF0_9BACI|nr:BglG family transcription antiterminator [Bacillus chungangensis]MDQ0177799.1 transcriptional antiterminator/mannitol/fructose-specific phosphotransferase system IIA component (Ntr-type) [Bacillus chungangensis]